MHLRAYDAYCKKWGPQAAMIDLEGRNCRGGFGTEELDEFIPGWRDELSEIKRLRAALEEIAREQSASSATVIADRFQQIARATLAATQTRR